MYDDLKLVLTALSTLIFIIFSSAIIVIFSPFDDDITSKIFLMYFLIILPSIPIVIFIRNQKNALNKINDNKKIKLFINPFMDLQSLLSWIKTDEKILNQHKGYNVWESDFYLHPILNFSLLPELFVKPIIIETDKAYYIDTRRPKIISTLVSAPFIIIFFSLFYPSIWVLAYFLVIFLTLLVVILVFPLNQIRHVRKEWLTSENKDQKKLVLKGTSPKYALKTLNPDKSWGGFYIHFSYTYKLSSI